METSLKRVSWESKDKIFSYWPERMSYRMFILGEAYRNAGKKQESADAYNKVINDYQ